eukprot:CAMPEP_0204571078 /NCGR_PEP_ID=MMETSP0661-20131031/38683_1 /ASSEMBLY_ACC=CAM_ASM_000606 /TAXON_ID=109239 /ORGANISM="Alexandrium margalefi, Strain AMGDE01CS-322" /LENGTH=61 /DNA_ID=CAMNT_0051579303 /DNA_START=54 /DNA_END=236 /DNA_ORIENTATION=+
MGVQRSSGNPAWRSNSNAASAHTSCSVSHSLQCSEILHLQVKTLAPGLYLAVCRAYASEYF